MTPVAPTAPRPLAGQRRRPRGHSPRRTGEVGTGAGAAQVDARLDAASAQRQQQLEAEVKVREAAPALHHRER